MLDEARKQNLMLEETFSKRNKMADDSTLTKVLTYDIICLTRRSAGLASVEADNCYDRIAHAIASLVFQAFGVPLLASKAMLTTIQEMNFSPPNRLRGLNGLCEFDHFYQDSGSMPGERRLPIRMGSS